LIDIVFLILTVVSILSLFLVAAAVPVALVSLAELIAVFGVVLATPPVWV
jgi:hypothetical protein